MTTTILIAATLGSGAEASVPVSINGVSTSIPVGKPTPVSDEVLDALKNSDRSYTVVEEQGESQAPGEGGGASGGGALASASTGAARDVSDGDHLVNGHIEVQPSVADLVNGTVTQPGENPAEGEGEKAAAAPGTAAAADPSDPASDVSDGDHLVNGHNEVQPAPTGEAAAPLAPDELTAGNEKAEGRALMGDGTATDPAEVTDPASSEGFDPEKIIGGNVDQVADSLSDLDRAQVAKVEEAEIDREKPRAGVLKAVAARRAALDQDEQG